MRVVQVYRQGDPPGMVGQALFPQGEEIGDPSDLDGQGVNVHPEHLAAGAVDRFIWVSPASSAAASKRGTAWNTKLPEPQAGSSTRCSKGIWMASSHIR